MPVRQTARKASKSVTARTPAKTKAPAKVIPPQKSAQKTRQKAAPVAAVISSKVEPSRKPPRNSTSVVSADHNNALPGANSIPAPPARSKQAEVLALLEQSSGATLATIMERTGWQAHSVRGFLAGVVRRKLQLALISEKIDGARIYRLADANAPRSRVPVTAQALPRA